MHSVDFLLIVSGNSPHLRDIVCTRLAPNVGLCSLSAKSWEGQSSGLFDGEGMDARVGLSQAP